MLKKEYMIQDGNTPDHMIPRFVITGEISSIYKKCDKVRKVHSLLILPGLKAAENLSEKLEVIGNLHSDGRPILGLDCRDLLDKVRKVHSLLILPGLKAAENLSEKLEVIGNLHSDGRPILGLDCRDLLEIMLEATPDGMYVPAHIWTPHFSMFGAFSGFDTVEECFGDLSSHIHAVETGLYSCSGDGIILGSADELAGVHAGPVSVDFQFRCAFSGKTGKRGHSSGYRLFLCRSERGHLTRQRSGRHH